MITTPSDYTKGRTQLPNAVSKNASQPENDDLLEIISDTEEELLLLLLGESQYETLKTELLRLPFVPDTDPPSLETAGQDWQDLVNGKGKFKGLKSICKNLVYCEYLRFMEIKVTTTGAGKAKVKNHTVTDYNQKYVDRYNEFVDWVDGLKVFLMESTFFELVSDHPCFKYENQFGL